MRDAAPKPALPFLGHVSEVERTAVEGLYDQLHGKAPFTHDPAPYLEARARAQASQAAPTDDHAAEVAEIRAAGFVRAPWPQAGWVDAGGQGRVVTHADALEWARKDLHGRRAAGGDR